MKTYYFDVLVRIPEGSSLHNLEPHQVRQWIVDALEEFDFFEAKTGEDLSEFDTVQVSLRASHSER